MRPVDKRKHPLDENGDPKEYTEYGQAKDDLKNALGYYCSYCEMNISNQADVEHVIPKKKPKGKDLILDWGNFLLGCKTCNREKSNNNDDREGYLFPDTHNTAYAYKYTKTKVLINSELTDEESEKAQATLDLVNINRKKDSNGRVDDRRFARLREWQKAVESLKDYKIFSSEPMARQIGRSPEGFFSLWLEVFKDYPEVKKEILCNKPGTAQKCYDQEWNPVKTLKR